MCLISGCVEKEKQTQLNTVIHDSLFQTKVRKMPSCTERNIFPNKVT